jgi:hypothetical protein
MKAPNQFHIIEDFVKGKFSDYAAIVFKQWNIINFVSTFTC